MSGSKISVYLFLLTMNTKIKQIVCSILLTANKQCFYFFCPFIRYNIVFLLFVISNNKVVNYSLLFVVPMVKINKNKKNSIKRKFSNNLNYFF